MNKAYELVKNTLSGVDIYKDSMPVGAFHHKKPSEMSSKKRPATLCRFDGSCTKAGCTFRHEKQPTDQRHKQSDKQSDEKVGRVFVELARNQSETDKVDFLNRLPPNDQLSVAAAMTRMPQKSMAALQCCQLSMLPVCISTAMLQWEISDFEQKIDMASELDEFYKCDGFTKQKKKSKLKLDTLLAIQSLDEEIDRKSQLGLYEEVVSLDQQVQTHKHHLDDMTSVSDVTETDPSVSSTGSNVHPNKPRPNKPKPKQALTIKVDARTKRLLFQKGKEKKHHFLDIGNTHSAWFDIREAQDEDGKHIVKISGRGAEAARVSAVGGYAVL